MHSFLEDFLRSPSKSDKLEHHGYHRTYPWFLAHFRDKPVTLLEIGIDKNESLRLWKGYFPKMTLFGIDRDLKVDNDESIRIFQVDQSQESQLKGFADTVGLQFDFIIDDGSHVPSHQIRTLQHFWKLLKPGGVYIVEDVETSYWGRSSIYGYPFNAHRTEENLIRQFQTAPDFVNAEFLTPEGKAALKAHPLSAVLSDIEMISYSYNSVILVKKDHTSFESFYERDYRGAWLINKDSLFKQFKRSIKKLLGRA